MADKSDLPGVTPQPSARDIRVPPIPHKGNSKPQLSPTALAAKEWWDFGLKVIPVIAGTKVTAVKWNRWLDSLAADYIAAHWAEHPDDDVGCILGNELVVLDSDSPEAEQAVVALEAHFGITSALVIKSALQNTVSPCFN